MLDRPRLLLFEDRLASLDGRRWQMRLQGGQEFHFYLDTQVDRLFQVSRLELDQNLVLGPSNMAHTPVFHFRRVRPVFFSFVFFYANHLQPGPGGERSSHAQNQALTLAEIFRGLPQGDLNTLWRSQAFVADFERFFRKIPLGEQAKLRG